MSKNQCSCERIYGNLRIAMLRAYFFFHGDLDWNCQCRAEKLHIILSNTVQSYFI